MKCTQNKPLISASLIFITMLLALGLVFTIKYAYFDEIKHYHTGTCYIRDCASTPTECCNTVDGETICVECYNIKVTFDFHLNETSCTKSDSITNKDSDYCSNRNHVVPCYYDDRDVCDSVRVFYHYKGDGAILGIILLSGGLLIMLIVSLVVIIRFEVLERNKTWELN